MTTETKILTLGEFAPHSVWYSSVGSPAGDTLECYWTADETGGEIEHIPPTDPSYPLPEGWLELSGEIDADGRWCWDGQGDPRDLGRNTVLSLVAYPVPA